MLPQTFEAKTIAFIDSASHMTDSLYFNIAKDNKKMNQKFEVYAKMERDMRDLDLFPEIKEELKELFTAWKSLLQAYEKLDFN